MNAANTMVEIYADSSLEKNGRYFFIARQQFDQIHKTGIHIEFEEEAFKALITLSERIQLSSDCDDIELWENFRVPQASEEGLALNWQVVYYQNQGKYFVMQVEE